MAGYPYHVPKGTCKKNDGMPYVQPLKRLANDILRLKAHLKYGGLFIQPMNWLATLIMCLTAQINAVGIGLG